MTGCMNLWGEIVNNFYCGNNPKTAATNCRSTFNCNAYSTKCMKQQIFLNFICLIYAAIFINETC